MANETDRTEERRITYIPHSVHQDLLIPHEVTEQGTLIQRDDLSRLVLGPPPYVPPEQMPG